MTWAPSRTCATWPQTLRESGISLCLDLVLNHVAREHEWAVAARAGDRREAGVLPRVRRPVTAGRVRTALPEVFPDFAPGNFTWDDDLAAWVWTTFNDYQWDLNWANPAVLCEFADIILNLANLGVEIFRLDAIAFLWKRLGTSSQNEPEVHDITQALRAVARMAAPAVLFKAEAIVGPADLPAYLGVGDHAGKVSDLAYHNSLMVQVWSMLACRDVTLGTRALQRLPQPPSTHVVDHLPALPRRHRLGDRRRRRGVRGALRVRAPALPVRLVLRRLPRLLGARPGVPAEPGNRRQPDLRLAGLARRARGRRPGRRRPDPARARDHPRFRWSAGDLDG